MPTFKLSYAKQRMIKTITQYPCIYLMKYICIFFSHLRQTWFQNKRASLYGSRRPKRSKLPVMCPNQSEMSQPQPIITEQRSHPDQVTDQWSPPKYNSCHFPVPTDWPSHRCLSPVSSQLYLRAFQLPQPAANQFFHSEFSHPKEVMNSVSTGNFQSVPGMYPQINHFALMPPSPLVTPLPPVPPISQFTHLNNPFPHPVTGQVLMSALMKICQNPSCGFSRFTPQHAQQYSNSCLCRILENFNMMFY